MGRKPKCMVDKTRTLCKYGNTWYFVENGKWNNKATTLCKYSNKWYYVKNGKMDRTYTGYVNYNGSKYYICCVMIKLREGIVMDIYSVKEMADMLDINTENVRRWSRLHLLRIKATKLDY